MTATDAVVVASAAVVISSRCNLFMIFSPEDVWAPYVESTTS